MSNALRRPYGFREGSKLAAEWGWKRESWRGESFAKCRENKARNANRPTI
jgi:hypothetical protein